MASPTPILPPVLTTFALSGRRKLTLGRELGRGSASKVLRAVVETDHYVRRAVALKVFDCVTPEEQEAGVSSLARAVQRAACIRHPNVVDTYELIVLETKQPAILSELIEGTTLAALIERHARVGRRVPLDLALFIATEIAEALHGARTATTAEEMQAGVAHLDLATCEVLLSWNGEVKVSDFGIGHATRFGSSVRSLRAIAQRASTMAPEIARGRAGDTRSDVFSLGIILREMLIGPRFPSTFSEAQALEHARDGFVPTTFLELQLPKEVRSIIARAIEIDATRRFPHATALAYELRRVALSMGVGDGRVFLRNALAQDHEIAALSAARLVVDPEACTDEIEAIGPLSPRADRTSGLIRKAGSPDRNSGTNE